jgi:hypothetical protein
VSKAAAHIKTAAQSGMRSGLNAYMASCAASGLPEVQERYGELLDMSGKARFQWYCAKFGPDVDAIKGARPSVRERVRNAVAPATRTIDDEIAQAEARLKALKEQAKAKPEQATVTRNAPTGPQIKLIERIARKKGDTVEVTVTLNGRKLSFEQGTRYIDANITLLPGRESK